MIIEFLRFHPVEKVKSHIGFASFRYNKEFSFNDIPVHKIKMPVSPKRKVRLRYPDNVFPFNAKAQNDIDEEVSAYISAEYREVLSV